MSMILQNCVHTKSKPIREKGLSGVSAAKLSVLEFPSFVEIAFLFHSILSSLMKGLICFLVFYWT
jgi:hypothetical protein